jgi:hypothetical protein
MNDAALRGFHRLVGAVRLQPTGGGKVCQQGSAYITAPRYHGTEFALAVAVLLALGLGTGAVSSISLEQFSPVPSTDAVPSAISPQFKSMSSSCFTHSGVFVES